MAKEPASVRYRNPGAMWGNNAIARKWGATDTVTLNDGKGQGNNIAVFPTFVQGICAQLDLWRTSKNYKNKRFCDAIAIWSGHNEVESYIRFVLARVPGMTRDTVMDDAFWQSPMGVAFLKAQAWHEAGKEYPAHDADWIEAQRTVFGKEVDKPVTPPPPDIEPEEPEDRETPPIAVKDPWYKRAWKWAASTLFGGGIMIGGFQLNADTLLAATLLLIVAGIAAAVYFIGKKKGWWG